MQVKSYIDKTRLDWYHPNDSVTRVAQQCDLAWALCRNVNYVHGENPELQAIPCWKAFNVQVSLNTSYPSDTVGYLPLYDGSSQDASHIRTVMIRAHERTTALDQPETVVACDLGIYQIARKIKEVEPETFKNTVVRIGVFHLHMKFMEVIGDRYGRAGLEELLSRSGLYGQCTVKMILLGKAYNKAVRSAKLMYEVCFRLIFAEFIKEDDNIEFLRDINEQARVFTSEYNYTDKYDSFTKFADSCLPLSEKLESFISKKSLHSSTFMFWAELWKMLGILLRLIRADRECDFRLHLSAVAECLPYMFSFDKQNYARWLSVYLADMNSLETSAPTVYHEFLNGRALSVNGKSHHFNAVSLDMRLEQSLNKHAKGSLKGISSNPKARDKFLLTAHHMADIHSAVIHMCGLNFDVHTCKEAGKQQVYRDEVDVRRLINTLSGPMLNPFTTDGMDLIQIANRRKASEAVQKGSTDSQKIGVIEMDLFVKERIHSDKKSLSDPIRRSKIATFRTTERSKLSKNQVKSTKPHGTFSSLFQAKTTVEEAMKNELTDEYPESLFRSHFSFIKKDKSLLMKALEDGISDSERTFPTLHSSELVIIYDGMALVHSLMKSFKNAQTFGDISKTVLTTLLHIPHEAQNILDFQNLRIDIVMDQYNDYSPKDIERQQRTQRKGKSALNE